MPDDLLTKLRSCRDSDEMAAFLRRVDFDNGYAFQAAVTRCRLTPLAEALRLFWWFSPIEGDLAFDRTTEVSGLQLEMIKRVEIGYYPKAQMHWSFFGVRQPNAAQIAGVLDHFQGIVPRSMLGTEFN
ncbi:MAG: hypothetical protein H0X45_01580 [Planctomycetes bacterium]|nr:hypothetical protein [Planctomycetota bacterium]